ncbi:MAG: hypothetical protein WCJ51_03155 [Candidatus Moraniibacteriota bacterium]
MESSKAGEIPLKLGDRFIMDVDSHNKAYKAGAVHETWEITEIPHGGYTDYSCKSVLSGKPFVFGLDPETHVIQVAL